MFRSGRIHLSAAILLAGCASMTGADLNQALSTISDTFLKYDDAKREAKRANQATAAQAQQSQAYTQQSYTPPAPRAAAWSCQTQIGVCRLPVASQPGGSCYCNTPKGPVPGYTQ